jgi:ABC-type phosphate transport system substrate-binding protein
MRYSARLLVVALVLSGPVFPLARATANSEAMLAQAPTFELPETVPSGTALSIQSSPNMGTTAQELQKQFEAAYEGTDISVEVTSSDAAITALLDGGIDLAAIGRPLTQEEMDQGLTTVPLEREKIAIIVGPENPFSGNLTFEQFAAMFRGEITDWSEVGGAPGPIRFVDRPELSDTRRSLSQYEVFRNAPFALGATGEAVAEDDTAVVIQALGNDGISYAIAPHVLEQDSVKIISMHETLPDDPRYPYSQPRYFVFKDTAAPAVAAFLGFMTSPEGAAALAAARQAETAAVTTALATGTAGTATDDEAATTADPQAEAEAAPTEEADAVENAELDGDEAAAGVIADADAGDTDAAGAAVDDDEGGAGWLWWLLPIAAGLGALAWLLSRGKSGDTPTVEHGAPAAGVAPPLESPPEPATTADTTPVEASSSAPKTTAANEPEPPSPAPASALEAETSASIDDVSPAPVPPVATNGSTPTPEPPAISDPAVGGNAFNNSGVTPPATGDVPTVPDVAPTPMSGSIISAAAGAAGLAAGAAASLASTEDQSAIEASKYNVVGRPADGDIDLSGLDDGLPPLPDGYGESRIVLMPRDPQWAYSYWDTPSSHKEELRSQGGERLALRLYDVTDVDLSHQSPHSMQQFDCDELAREWYLQIPVSDRDYMVEIGYLAGDGRWLVLAKSNTVRIPPVYPSDWTEEHFMTVGWEENLKGKTLMALVDPRLVNNVEDATLHDQMFSLSQASELQRVSGSIFGSMQHVPGSMVPQQAISSYIFPSGVGRVGAPGAPEFPGLNMSGLNVSGLTMSGVGFSASAPPIRPRKFWLVADAELIVYGATEPDASVTVGGNPIQLTPDGTFRFQTAFPDGQIDYPIMGVASDGEQSRSIHMKFERRTPERRTNTKEEAQEEWPEE